MNAAKTVGIDPQMTQMTQIQGKDALGDIRHSAGFARRK
jgi:hypothetical protein